MLGPSYAIRAVKASDCLLHFAGTRSFTLKKNRTNAMFVKKHLIARLHLRHISAPIVMIKNLFVIAVAKVSIKRETCEITFSFTREKSRISAACARKLSINCRIWSFICMCTQTIHHTDVNFAKFPFHEDAIWKVIFRTRMLDRMQTKSFACTLKQEEIQTLGGTLKSIFWSRLSGTLKRS